VRVSCKLHVSLASTKVDQNEQKKKSDPSQQNGASQRRNFLGIPILFLESLISNHEKNSRRRSELN
jgi:hypothetical protein